MNRKELIQLVAVRTGKSQKEITKILTEILAVIAEGLSKGETVKLIDFGTFSAKTYPVRVGRLFQTGETIEISEYQKVCFSSSKSLKRIINN